MTSLERTTAGLEAFLANHRDIMLEKQSASHQLLQQAGKWLVGSVSLQSLFNAEQGDTDGKELAEFPS